MLNPFLLSQAVDKARHQEKLLIALGRKEKGQWSKGENSGPSTMSKGTIPVPNSQNNQLFEYRRSNGLCYKCGEKYQLGHQCKPKHLNAMTAIVEQRDEEIIEGSMPVEGSNGELQIEEVMEEAISLNALAGTEIPNTIRLRGEAKKH